MISDHWVTSFISYKSFKYCPAVSDMEGFNNYSTLPKFHFPRYKNTIPDNQCRIGNNITSWCWSCTSQSVIQFLCQYILFDEAVTHAGEWRSQIQYYGFHSLVRHYEDVYTPLMQ